MLVRSDCHPYRTVHYRRIPGPRLTLYRQHTSADRCEAGSATRRPKAPKLTNWTQSRSFEMAASESQYAANRLNSLKSTGPKTVEGKQKTRLNGMVHGLASTVLSTEDAQAFEERMDEVATSMRPRNALEKLILANSVRASWMIDRTARVQTARLDSLIDGEPARAIEQIFSLGKRLFFNAHRPIRWSRTISIYWQS